MNIHFASWHQFLNMGGYADYVWPAYSLAFAILIILPCIAFFKLRSVKKNLRERHANQA